MLTVILLNLKQPNSFMARKRRNIKGQLELFKPPQFRAVETLFGTNFEPIKKPRRKGFFLFIPKTMSQQKAFTRKNSLN